MWSASHHREQATPVPASRLIPWAFERARPLLALLEAIRPRDPSLAEHGESVGDLAALAGERLGLPDFEVAALRLAGALHDIGKVAIPDRILQKPAPLDDVEWAQVRRHSEVGCRLLRSVGLEEIAEWVHVHHERPDGRGYPRGLTSGEIPIQGAILAAADAYRAMREDRPYRRGLGQDDAMAELVSCTATQFEPDAVEAVIGVVDGADVVRLPRAIGRPAFAAPAVAPLT